LQSRLYYEDLEQDIDYLLVLSGLEPHRTFLEEQVLDHFRNTEKKVFIVGGTAKSDIQDKGIEFKTLSNTKELNQLVNRAKCIISRAGYSSIMDWQKLNKKAIIIPTPGQPEQEYLAVFYQNHPNFTVVKELS
jgi:UDP-N-acetylglucosamine transferase subunit ALG13